MNSGVKGRESLLNLNAEDLMNKLIEIAEDNPQRYISPATLRHMYRGFCQWRQMLHSCKGRRKKELKGMIPYYRNLIHYLLERCYWIRYGDSDMVSDILKELFDTDGHLGKIFDFQQLSITPRKGKLDSNIKCDSDLAATTWTTETLWNEEIQPISYFLEHTNRTLTHFDGKRLTRRYFVQSMQKLSRHAYNVLFVPPCSRTFMLPDVLLSLLKYGLFVKSKPNNVDIGKLLTGVIGGILTANKDSQKSTPYSLRMVQVGNILLRAIPSVKMSNILKDQSIENKKIVLPLLIQCMSSPDYLPMLKKRCSGLQELQHLCRRVIRRSLYNNWKVPSGIELLPLPEPLKRYIHLQSD